SSFNNSELGSRMSISLILEDPQKTKVFVLKSLIFPETICNSFFLPWSTTVRVFLSGLYSLKFVNQFFINWVLAPINCNSLGIGSDFFSVLMWGSVWGKA